jgi:hypothetical protein
MSGCFGLLDDVGNPYHVPPERLTESHPCVTASALWQAGLMVEGASGRLAGGPGPCQITVREGGIFIDGFRIQAASHPVLPWTVFLCPACSCVRYKLFQVHGQWACYRCHGLTHASRHKHRTIPQYHRLMRLRRKIGASLVPFSPIAPRSPRQRRYWKIVAEIRRLEAALVQHARCDVADVLERRHDRSGNHGPGDR